MGGGCIHPLGRSYSEPSIFHFLPGTAGQQVFLQRLPTPRPGTSRSGVPVRGEDGSPAAPR